MFCDVCQTNFTNEWAYADHVPCRRVAAPPAPPEPEIDPLDSTPVDLDDHPETARELAKVIDEIREANRQSWSTFSDVLTLWDTTLRRFSPGAEEEYLAQVARMTPDAVRLACKGFAILMQHFVIDGCFSDLLGSTYMEISGKWKQSALGQYFTPWPVALCMAEMTVHDHDWTENPYPSVCEPCAGSGVMLLALRGFVARERGRYAASRLRLHGQDVDPVCVMMARIQITLTNDLFMRDFLLASYGELARVLETGGRAIPINSEESKP